MQLLTAIGLSSSAEPGPSFFHVGGRWEVALAVVLVAVVAVSEETIFRGYLVRRLQAATSSTTAAVLLSSVIFALGHGYEGSLGAVTVGVMGLIFALLYLWRQSLIVPIVLHFLQDFLAIVVARTCTWGRPGPHRRSFACGTHPVPAQMNQGTRGVAPTRSAPCPLGPSSRCCP